MPQRVLSNTTKSYGERKKNETYNGPVDANGDIAKALKNSTTTGRVLYKGKPVGTAIYEFGSLMAANPTRDPSSCRNTTGDIEIESESSSTSPDYCPPCGQPPEAIDQKSLDWTKQQPKITTESCSYRVSYLGVYTLKPGQWFIGSPLMTYQNSTTSSGVKNMSLPTKKTEDTWTRVRKGKSGTCFDCVYPS